MPPTKTWKQAERRLASLFGTTRRALSGGNSKSGGRDDAHHPRVYLECKHSIRHALWELWRKCRRQTGQELKKPKRRVAIALYEKGKEGALLVVHQDDILQVALQVFEALTNEPEFPYSRHEADELIRKLEVMGGQL